MNTPTPKHNLTIEMSRILDLTLQELQMREEIDHTHVDDLKGHLDELPPITVFQDGEFDRYFIGDGWHRFLAHKLSNKKQIKADIRPGGKDAALRHSLGANAEHDALRRTNRDKRKAVKIALKSHSAIFGTDKIKNVAVAELCKVAESFVRKVRKELEIKADNQPTESGSTGGEPPAQTDFFAELNASYKTIADGFNQVLNHTYFIRPDVTKAEKLAAVADIQRDLANRSQSIKDLKAKLEAQEDASGK